MGAIYGLLRMARGGRLNTNQRAEVLQNARIGLNTIARDAINAGVGYPNFGATIPDNALATVLGGTADTDTDPDLLTPVFARDGLHNINGVATDQLTFVFIDDTFNNGESIAIADISTNGSQVEFATGYTNDPCSLGDVYIISGQNGSALGTFGQAEDEEATPSSPSANNVLDFPSGDPIGINLIGAESPISKIQAPASLQRVSWVNYYIASEDANGTGTGTLMRRVYGGDNGWVDQPLAFGIENMQIQYVLLNGTVVDVPAADQMVDIRQVRVSITIRSPDIDPNTNEPFRSTLTTTISTRNLVYEKF
jgi:hypothetical protein